MATLPIEHTSTMTFPTSRSNMTSHQLLAAAQHQLARTEDDWRRNSSISKRKPLRITTYWFKPASDEPGKGRIPATRPESREWSIRTERPMDSQAAKHSRSSSRHKSQGSSPEKDKLRKETSGIVRISIVTSEPTDIPFQAAGRAPYPVQSPKERRVHRHKKPSSAARAAEDSKATEETTAWKEVRWTEPPSRGSPPKANTKGEMNSCGPRPDTAAVNRQPVNTQTGEAPPREATKSAFKNGEADGTAIHLAHRPARPRSHSRVRPRLEEPKPRMRKEIENQKHRHHQAPDTQTRSEHKNKSKAKIPPSSTDQHEPMVLRCLEHAYPADAPRGASSRRRSRPVYGRDWRIISPQYTYFSTINQSGAS